VFRSLKFSENQTRCGSSYPRQTKTISFERFLRFLTLRTVRPIYRTGVSLPSRWCILYIFFQQI